MFTLQPAGDVVVLPCGPYLAAHWGPFTQSVTGLCAGPCTHCFGPRSCVLSGLAQSTEEGPVCGLSSVSLQGWPKGWNQPPSSSVCRVGCAPTLGLKEGLDSQWMGPICMDRPSCDTWRWRKGGLGVCPAHCREQAVGDHGLDSNLPLAPLSLHR